jgi:hypothetical protein
MKRFAHKGTAHRWEWTEADSGKLTITAGCFSGSLEQLVEQIGADKVEVRCFLISKALTALGRREKVSVIGDGSGNGSVAGRGDGKGCGWGYAEGYGYGCGNGCGCGNGRGNGWGYGIGNGQGFGDGSGYGRGKGYGSGCISDNVADGMRGESARSRIAIRYPLPVCDGGAIQNRQQQQQLRLW